MASEPDDAYGNFMIRTVNAIRIAENQAGGMSEGEKDIVTLIRETIRLNDEPSLHVPKADIIIRLR